MSGEVVRIDSRQRLNPLPTVPVITVPAVAGWVNEPTFVMAALFWSVMAASLTWPGQFCQMMANTCAGKGAAG